MSAPTVASPEEQETIRQVDEVLRQVRDMITDDLISGDKARQLRLDAIKRLKTTTTNVKATITVLKHYVSLNLLPEEEFNDAKDILADVITDPAYQTRLSNLESAKRKQEREIEKIETKASKLQEFKAATSKDTVLGNMVVQYQSAQRAAWNNDDSKRQYEKEFRDLKYRSKRCCYFCWPFGGCERCLPCKHGEKTLEEKRRGTCMSGLWLFMPPFLPVLIFLIPFWIVQRITQCRMNSRKSDLDREIQNLTTDIQRSNAEMARLRADPMLQPWLEQLDEVITEEKHARLIEHVSQPV
eukprot:TRINITY_DN8611_c0_g1_i1.p1 TRINITY_DN8611_c0_g1~~TRINITY_DN8611_c0_g1_i1.p1  ORF type:complete len:298 (+),score=39.73 TRINITY_DN8611_c0_g1_i1:121-1014(+)